MYNFKKLINTDSQCYKTGGTRNGLPEGILIHGTGCENPWLHRWVKGIGKNRNLNYYGGENNPVCTPHAAAGLDENGEICIAQILPYNYKCWGCGKGKKGSYNATHIQIEVSQCTARGEKYCRDIFRAVAEWCADLCLEFKLDPMYDIVSHREAHKLGYASNHGDPENWIEQFGFSMDMFREMVQTIIDDKRGITEESVASWAVQVGLFTVRENAINYAKELRKKYGLECFIVDKHLK